MDATELFSQATDKYLADLYASQPVMATSMGVHLYDDQLPDSSPGAVTRELERARSYLHTIDGLSIAHMSSETRLDYRLARADSQMRIILLEQGFQHAQRPALYLDTALNGLYQLLCLGIDAQATTEEALLGRLQSFPRYLHDAYTNIQNAPSIFRQIAIDMLPSGQIFLCEDLENHIEGIRDRSLQAALTSCLQAARQALDDFGSFLIRSPINEAEYSTSSGRDLYDYMLRMACFMDETGADLQNIALVDMDLYRLELAQTAAKIAPNTSWRDTLSNLQHDDVNTQSLDQSYRIELDKSYDYVRLRRMVELPRSVNLNIRSTPSWMHTLHPDVTYMPTPPFEAGSPGAIQWNTNNKYSRYSLPVYAVEQGYPGKHLQAYYNHELKSLYRKHYATSRLFTEGWALYAGEIMVEHGYLIDPRCRLIQLADRYERACMMLTDTELHIDQMLPAQAVELLIQRTGMGEQQASDAVSRCLMFPTRAVGNYMGFKQLQAIAQYVLQRSGPRFNSLNFHNTLLSYGAIPPRLIQEQFIAPVSWK